MWFRSIWFIGIALGMVLALAPNLVWLLTAAVGKMANYIVPWPRTVEISPLP